MKNLREICFLLLSVLIFSVGCKKNKINKTPVANAGLAQVIQLPVDFVLLSGSGKDEDGSIASYLWTQLSGPNSSAIQSSGSSTTKVTGLITGTYHFQLKVVDNNGASGTDSVAVTVLAPFNKVPVSNAGNSAVITLPTDFVSVSGSGTDADGNIVAYLWSQISGPSSTVIDNPGATSTQIKGFKEGKYVFQLMVTDNQGATGVDTASVTVNPDPIKTLIVQPTNNPNEIIFVLNNGVDNSSISMSDLPLQAWTNGGNPFYVRAAIKFDLSTIPVNATIVSANLYLYSYPNPTINGNHTDANFGTDNTVIIQQITSNWTSSTASWANQPASTTVNQVVVPHTNQSVLDLNLNVTDMVASMVSGNNYGFFLRLQNEAIYTSRLFVASHNTTYITKYPKLVVTYH